MSTLIDLPRHTDATIREVVAHGPVGGDPVLVQIGFTRFALRRSEAARVLVQDVSQQAPAEHEPRKEAA